MVAWSYGIEDVQITQSWFSSQMIEMVSNAFNGLTES